LKTDCYDVGIVGGGPAGAVAGMISARLGLRTIVLEAEIEPKWKPGEVLAPECNPILRSIDLWSVLTARPDLATLSAGVRSSWGNDHISLRDGFCEPLGAGWIIQRQAFERFLSEQAAAAGAHWVWGARVHSVEHRNGVWEIAANGLAEPLLFARFLIDATGRPAKLARRLGARRVRYQPQIVAVARWAKTQSQSNWLNIESVPGGWWYAVSDPGSLQVLAWFGDYTVVGPSRHAFWGAFAATHFLQSALALPAATEDVHITIQNAEGAALDRCAGMGWLAVGDAAMSFDPIASQGLSNAFASAHAAAYAASSCLQGKSQAGDTYAAEMSAAYEFYLGSVQRHYRSEQRWPDCPFWRRRHANSRSQQYGLI
jgi:flavin-dependent dehydrogenase